MRIIAGKYARRGLLAPEGLATRPTADRVREAVFNILQHQDWRDEAIVGRTVLDACCGTGALALEAISRGAAAAWLLEQDAVALQVAKQNITALGAGGLCHLLRADACKPPPARAACDLLFLDPPYRKNLPAQIVPALQAQGWLAPDALLVIETARGEALSLPPEFALRQQRDYGAACVRFFSYHPEV